MRLVELELQNLRGIINQKLSVYDFTTFIGQNNSGKSTVLRAVQIFLNQEKPAEEEWHVDHTDEPIIIIGRFNDISENERDIPGIASLVYNAEIKLKLTITKGERNPDLNYTAYIRDEHIEGWSDTWGTISSDIRGIAESLGISGANWRTKANKERVRQFIRKERGDLVEYGEPSWTDEGISINEALKQGLPRVEIIPAVRDAKDEGQLTQTNNIFKEILNKSIFPEVESTDEYTTIIQKADELSQRMAEANGTGLERTNMISTELSETAGKVIDLKVLFRLEPPDIKSIIGKGARIRLSDGTETPVHFQGHGAQRTLIYSLVIYIAKQRAEDEDHTRPIIILFEEPELYVHPQLLRLLRQSLKDVSEINGWQVIVTTHSPVMIDVTDAPQSLIIMKRNQETSAIEAKQLVNDPFENDDGEISDRQALRAALDFHPSVCEAFFANQALLVEGDSEKAIFRYAKEALNALGVENCDIENTTIVSCGGKWTIPPIARLLKEFDIPFKVIHDMDRKGLTDEELKRKPAIHPFNANARISRIAEEPNVHVIEDTLEDILFDEGHSPTKDKPFIAWKKMREILDSEKMNDMQNLKNLFQFAYGIDEAKDN